MQKPLCVVAAGLSFFVGSAVSTFAQNGDYVQARSAVEIQFVGSDKTSRTSKVFADILKQAFFGMEAKNAGLRYQISWVEDRALIIDPLLTRKVFDIGFGWRKPDCTHEKPARLCRSFFFSKPVFSQTSSGGQGQSKTTYYAIIAKSHPRARTYLYYFNTAITRLQNRKEYGDILNNHGFALREISLAK